ncbi:MAG: O-antigen ligase family protein [Anaerolineae bacterium]|nr:O-antigen ligase family protein [Anaerolineae bacterium]
MTWLLKKTQLGQYFLASLLGLGIGGVVIILAGQGLSIKLFALVVGGMAGLIIVLITKDIKRLLIIVIFVDSISGLDFHLTCSKQYLLSSCGPNISITFLALAGLYALWMIDLRRNQTKQTQKNLKLDVIGSLAVCFLGAIVLSIIGAKRPDLAIFQLWNYTVIFLLFFYLVNYIKDKGSLLFIIYVMLFSTIIQLVLMEMQGFGLISSASSSTGDYARRVSGTLYSPNAAGSHLSQMLAMMITCLLIPMHRWHKWSLAVITLLTVHNLIGTESRGAWTAALISIAIIGVIGLWKRWIDVKSVVITLLVGTVLFTLFSGSITDRLTEDDKGSAEARAPLAEIAFNMIRANPITGIGINNFGVVLHDYVEPEQYGAWLHIVHNGWLLVWSETGTVGFALYVAFRVILAWQAFKIILSGDKLYSPIALGILASMAGAGFHMLGEIFNGRTLIQLLWIQAAILSSISWLQKQEAKAPNILQIVTNFSSKQLKSVHPFLTDSKHQPGA